MQNEIKEIFDEWKRFLSWCYENNDKTIEIHRDKIKYVMDYITNLQEERDFYRCTDSMNVESNIELRDRIDKAIEYIKHSQSYGTMAQVMPHLKPYVNGDDLLEILGDKENE